jgi:hypothetical protein
MLQIIRLDMGGSRTRGWLAVAPLGIAFETGDIKQ